MDIFKDVTVHTNLVNDIKHIHTCANECTTRLSEKTLDALVEQLNEEMFNNLTEEGATALANLSNSHPDSDIEWLLDFLAFKNSAKIEATKDFILRTGTEVDEDVVSQVRVYPGDFYIEVLDNGVAVVHQLILENSCWIEPETSLEEMELELYNFSQIVVVGG